MALMQPSLRLPPLQHVAADRGRVSAPPRSASSSLAPPRSSSASFVGAPSSQVVRLCSGVGVALAALQGVGRQRSARRRRKWRHWRSAQAVRAHILRSALGDDKAEAVGAASTEPLLVESWEAMVLSEETGFPDAELMRNVILPMAFGRGDESVGPVHFERLSTKEGAATLVLFLPGIDFGGLYAAGQLRGIAAEGHDVWRCNVGLDDRSSFAQLVDSVAKWISDRQKSSKQKIVLMGESFGGLLGVAVALRLGRKLKGLALVNPATSFGRTLLPLLTPPLVTLPTGEAKGPPTGEDLNEVLAEMNQRAQDSPYAYIGTSFLTALVGDGQQIGTTVSEIVTGVWDESLKDEPNILTPELRTLMAIPEQLAEFLPAATVRHRVRYWLRDGYEAVQSQLRGRAADKTPLPPTLVVLSKEDRLLPSASEASYLRPLLEPRCGPRNFEVVELDAMGHAPLDDRLDFPALLRKSPIFKPVERKDYVNDWKTPSLKVIQDGSKSVEGIADLLSPVFCSWDFEREERCFGLGGIPDPSVVGRPVLFVGNHQLLALDLGPMLREFIVELGFAPRGLAHPINFPEEFAELVAARPKPPRPQELLDVVNLPFELRSAVRAVVGGSGAEQMGPFGAAARRMRQGRGREGDKKDGDGKAKGEDEPEDFGVGGSFAKWGAVPVNGRNFFRLLKRGDPILLFPGGVREACHGPGDKYRLLWPEDAEFVRAAARFDAIVVPFGSIGSADNVSILGASKFDGPRERLSELDMPAFPNIAPRLSLAQQTSGGFGDRLYFSFGKPVDLRDLNPKDRAGCATAYDKIRTDVEKEIAWLLEKRVDDPFRDFLKRQAYERLKNFRKPARTIQAGELKGQKIEEFGSRAPSFKIC
eukprot:TRINITY_DN34139_c0_g1_i1.p1 TRINITY_DN34139_c0_g1~~TRINITY_DN34139_c0_g1_i1.p1  ORF type:complete len:886 (-),score=199.41 TRINITY_DN34139_c0_g1_i1:380-2998(-)